MTRLSPTNLILLCLWLSVVGACSKESEKATSASATSADSARINRLDSVFSETEVDEAVPSITLTPGMSVNEFIDLSPDSALYHEGVMEKIIDASEKYARDLINSGFERFIIVDKNTMAVILYDKYGRQLHRYPMACSRRYGTKHAKADNRTPEGFFKVYGIYDSEDWMFVDDNGVKSDIKGQFGPKFIRLNIPGTFQIGIHGTCAPWSIGGRRSHGCIRITNENILKLVELVDSGMPVIVNPGPRDAAMNQIEDYDIPLIDLDGKLIKSIDWHVRDLRAQMERDSLAALASDSLATSPEILDSLNVIAEE